MPYKEDYQKVYVVNSKGIPVQGVGGAFGIAAGANLDSFSRVRVSQPQGIFDAQLTYNLRPLLFEQVVTANGGEAIAHDATNRCALLTFANTPTGSNVYMQSYEHIPYQPGKSQAAFVTFNFIEPKANVLKFAGLSTGANGIELQQDGSTVQLKIWSDTTNGDQTIAKANWNIDKMDGSGVSGHTLDLTKTQILVIDFQALYVGRVRVGFDIDGDIHYVHQFVHANSVATPYIQTANLPIRCGMSSTGTVSTTMNFICSAVLSEGGSEDTAAATFSVEGTATAGNNARAHILSIQPSTTFNSIANRAKFVMDSFDIIVTGNTAIYWELVLGQAISGTTAFTAVNANYSSFEYNTAGTISGNPGLVIASGYVNATAQAKGVTSAKSSNRYPITLNAAGALRADNFGRMTMLVTGLGATSACRCAFNWREIR